MFNAPRLKRLANGLAACALALLLAPAASAQTIDLRLNIFYEVPSDINSGGFWQLIAKSSHEGIAGLNVKLTGITDVTNQAPRGIVNGNDPAGFALFEQLPNGFYLISQEPAFPGPGEVEGAFYGVGTIKDGHPGDEGHPFPPGSLSVLEGVPWASPDGDIFEVDESPWDTAALLLSGTFPDNSQPGFAPGITGRVFTSVPALPTQFGHAETATFGELAIRTNFVSDGIPGDYNLDDKVDAADYVVWRKGGLSAADGDGDGVFNNDPDDYDEWREHFGETPSVPGGSNQLTTAVPEPSSFVLLLVTGMLGSFTRRKHQLKPRPPVVATVARRIRPAGPPPINFCAILIVPTPHKTRHVRDFCRFFRVFCSRTNFVGNFS
jgi:hypothetical protein